MGGSKKQTVGYKYFLGQHLLLTTNRISILAMKFQDKIAWEGNAFGGSRISINKPSLFGGESREGGVSGQIDFLDGSPGQGPNDYLSRFINPLPAFRYVTSLVFRQTYIGNNYYIKPPSIKARDVQICKAWEPAIGEIPSQAEINNANIHLVIDDSTSMNNGAIRLAADTAGAFLRSLALANNVHIHRVQSATDLIISRTALNSSDYVELAEWCEAIPSTVDGPAFQIQDAATAIRDYANSVSAANLPFAVFEDSKKLFGSFQETQTDRRNIVILLSDGGITDDVEPALATLSGLNNLELYAIQFGGSSVNPKMEQFAVSEVPLIPLSTSPSAAATRLRTLFSKWVNINPAHIVYDMLTATVTRQNTNTNRIGNSFVWAAQRLYDENFGMSIYWRNRRDLQGLKEIVEKHIDGKVFFSRETGKWEISLTRDTIGAFSRQAIYIAIDVSGSMTSQRLATATNGVKKIIDELRGVDHSVRVVFFNSTVISSIERFNCGPSDYNDIIAFLNSPPTPASGSNFGNAVASAPAFFETDGGTYKKLIFITDGVPTPESSAASAMSTLRNIFNLSSYVIQIEETNTVFSSLISNLNNGVVPVVNSGDEDGLVGYAMSNINGILFDDSNVVEWKDDISLQTPSNLTNQITVTYRRKDNGENRALTVQDHASIAMYGEVNIENVDYQGIYDDVLAGQLVTRDLRARSSPKVSGSFVIPSGPPGFGPGAVMRVHNPRLGIFNKICRVLDVEKKSNVGSEMTVKFIEDTFSLAHTPDFVFEQQEPEDFGPRIPTARYVSEVPYYLAVVEEGQVNVDNELAVNPDIGGLMVLAAPENDNQIAVELATNQDGVWTNDGDFVYSRSVSTVTALSYEPTDTQVEITGEGNLVDVVINDLAIINDEFVRIDGYDPGTGILTIGRGCLDTIPRAHPIGSKIIVDVAAWFSDNRDYSDGEVLDVRLIPTSIIGRAQFSSLTNIQVEFKSRANAPYPPGNFQVDSVYVEPGVSIGAWTSLRVMTWKHRDRRFQTTAIPEDYLADNIGPETGTTYRIDIWTYDEDYNELIYIYSFNDIGAANIYSFDQKDFQGFVPGAAAFCEARLYSVRDGIDSVEYASVFFDAEAPSADFVFDNPTYIAPLGDAIDFTFGV